VSTRSRKSRAQADHQGPPNSPLEESNRLTTTIAIQGLTAIIVNTSTMLYSWPMNTVVKPHPTRAARVSLRNSAVCSRAKFA
jgi:hypothetical protein